MFFFFKKVYLIIDYESNLRWKNCVYTQFALSISHAVSRKSACEIIAYWIMHTKYSTAKNIRTCSYTRILNEAKSTRVSSMNFHGIFTCVPFPPFFFDVCIFFYSSFYRSSFKSLIFFFYFDKIHNITSFWIFMLFRVHPVLFSFCIKLKSTAAFIRNKFL